MDIADRHTIELHGHTVAFRMAGEGPALLLIHGIAGTNAVWESVFGELAADHAVIAPDLPGHGDSGASAGDYSLGAMAATVSDLLLALGHERATVVGHSLGGGVAMQFSYQFPELCERLVLVDSGGLGREVSLLLRSATLPGSEFVLPLLAQPRLLDAGRSVGRLLSGLGIGIRTDIDQLARGHASLADREAREAFVHTLRSIVDPGGQRVSATDRLYLAENMPFLIIWGARDRIIPVEHGRAAHRQVPGSRLEEFADSGHFPQLDEPERFVDTVTDFIESTEPSGFDPDQLRELLQRPVAKPAPG
jgi:pimeloyl-ACP methyl ester carboxylesterase